MQGTITLKAAMRRVAIAALFVATLPQCASAVTFITPSASVIDAQNNPASLTAGNTNLTKGFRFVDGGTSFNDYYGFTTMAPLGVTVTASVLRSQSPPRTDRSD